VDAKLYHMGTGVRDGRFFTSGGRVLMVVASGADVLQAREKVYREVAKIDCENLFYRKDIAHIALK
jgi:phosphoribosylamine--glycine ligase